MKFRDESWTYLIVTGVAILIWAWAANETRDQDTVVGSLRFSAQGEGEWSIEPPSVAVTVRVEGTTRSTQQAGDTFRSTPLVVPIPAEVGQPSIDLMEELRRHESVLETGVTIVSVEPDTATLHVDEIRPYPAPVVPALPGIQVENVKVDPPSATVYMPSKLRGSYPDLVVEAFIDPTVLDELEPGRAHSREATLRLKDAIGLAEQQITIEPDTAGVTLTVLSRIRQTVLESVRVQTAGPPESFREYEVRVDPPVLREVTISADADLINLVERGGATVVAFVHLSNRDMEQAIEQKKVAQFVALLDGSTDGRAVTGQVPDAAQLLISLEITRRE